MHSVDGKVVIVTGAGKGVGKGMALHLGKGARRSSSPSGSRELLEQTCAELDTLGVPNLGVRCDVQERTEIEAMVDQTMSAFGRVDGLINNAQTFRPMASIAEVTERDLDVFYTSGVKGTLWAMQAVYPHMQRQGGAGSSTSRRRWGSPAAADSPRTTRRRKRSARCTRTAAREWAVDGIVVNAIAPAAAAHHGPAGQQSEGARIFLENCPMGRQGDPELDIGGVAWFLCSDGCRFLTGHTFLVDGGAFMWA